MITSEKGMWTYLASRVKKYGHFTRIESGSTVLGQPDVNYCIAGVEGNLELKYASSGNRAKKLTLRASQYQWMNQRINAGFATHVWILAYVEPIDKWVLVHGSYAKGLITNPLIKHWIDVAYATWDGKINIEELIICLSSNNKK